MLKAGFVLDGKYRILSVIGQGGMSTVYLAVHERLKQKWRKSLEREGRIQTLGFLGQAFPEPGSGQRRHLRAVFLDHEHGKADSYLVGARLTVECDIVHLPVRELTDGGESFVYVGFE